MTDTETLNELIKNSGLKKEYIAEQLGISVPTLKRKINNEYEFKQSEITTLQKILKLSDKEVKKILL